MLKRDEIFLFTPPVTKELSTADKKVFANYYRTRRRRMIIHLIGPLTALVLLFGYIAVCMHINHQI